MYPKMTEYENNLVSIITPLYNASKYIKETVESVLSQTYENFEYIIVNDCSTDQSEDIVRSFSDKRIHILNNEINIGAALSRNKAINESKGRYIAFIDSDDVWEPEKLRKQIDLLSHTEYVMSYTGIRIMDDDGKYLKYQKVPEVMNYKKLLRNTAISTSSVVIDRRKVNIPIEMPRRRTGEDYALWLSILRNCGDAIGETDFLLRYRRSQNSLSKNRFDSFGDLWYGQHVVNGIGVGSFLINYVFFACRAVKKHYFR